MPSDKTTLSQRAEQWWPSQARKLDRSTVLTHESQWASYIEEQLGFYPMRRLANNPHLIAEWRDELLEAGVGAPTVARTMAVLSSCFTSAVERGVVPMNPVRGLPRPSVHGTRAIRALPPEVVEAIRLELLLDEPPRRDRSPRAATQRSGRYSPTRGPVLVRVSPCCGPTSESRPSSSTRPVSWTSDARMTTRKRHEDEALPGD